MKHIAKALAQQGRNGDSELLHVTKNELGYLGALAREHGLGSLPTNPKTGLPEANLFQTLLPIVGGAAGLFYGGPGGAALGSAAGSKLAGGSDVDALRAGAIGGIGGYLMPGAGAATAGATDAAGAGLGGTAGTAGLSSAAETGAADTGLGAATPSYLTEASNPYSFASQPEAVPAGMGAQPLPLGGMQATGTTPAVEGFTTNTGTAGADAAPSPGFGSKALDWMGDHPVQAAVLGSVAYNALSPQQTQMPQKRHIRMVGASHSGVRSVNSPYTYGGPEQNYFSGNDRMNYTKDPDTYVDRYADGGAVTPWVDPTIKQNQTYNPQDIKGQQTQQFQQAHDAWQPPPAATPPAAPSAYGADWYNQAAAANALKYPNAPQADPDQPSQGWWRGAGHVDANLGLANSGISAGAREAAQAIAPNAVQGASDTISHWSSSLGFAQGGILNLRPHRQTMDPIFVQGAGDGMSDSIPAQIDGQGQRPHEPIKVTDGEYIVPADAVAHAGNGSSNAGAKQMDKMVAGLRKARTGRAKQAPQINANRFIPK